MLKCTEEALALLRVVSADVIMVVLIASVADVGDVTFTDGNVVVEVLCVVDVVGEAVVPLVCTLKFNWHITALNFSVHS